MSPALDPQVFRSSLDKRLASKSFDLVLRPDTAVLQGGANARKHDPACVLRGPSVRGLFHTFARALIAPFVDGGLRATRDAELRLLGSAAENGKGGRTFGMKISQNDVTISDDSFLFCPPDNNKGRMKGLVNGKITVRLQPNLAAVPPECRELFPAMLWAVAWTAFSFGAIGRRCRRGYGSLTIESARIADSMMSDEYARGLSCFKVPPRDASELAESLNDGLEHARSITRDWLISTGLTPTTPTGIIPFFSLHPCFVSVGREDTDSLNIISALKLACSDAMARSGDNYPKFMGGNNVGGGGVLTGNPRSSPLWVRIYKTQGGYVPLATWSPVVLLEPEELSIVTSVLQSIGAMNSGKLNSIDSIGAAP